jgi:hypothetical protein
MKTIKYMMLMLLSLLTLAACSDDDDASSQMSISKVYLEDAESTVPDREVTFARLGQLIRIEGSGFTGLRKVYINGYDTYFNNALVTDNNIWVTLNGNTPISTAADSVRNTIILVKDNATLTYEFTIRASSPSITSVDNTLPQPGETVTVSGTNLQEITKVILPGNDSITSGIESDPDGEWFTFVMPEGITECGSITCEGANGTAVSPAFFNDDRCYIINFDGEGVQGSWSATFGPSDLVEDPLSSGRGMCVQLIPDSYYEANGVVAAGVSNIKGWWTAGNGESTDDWNRMTEYLPATTPVTELALQFDVYVPDPWYLTGQLEITLQNNLANYGWGSAGTQYSTDYINQATVWVPWLDESTGAATSYQTSSWKTITIPLTKFGNYTDNTDGITFQNVIDDRNAGSYRNFGFLFCNSDLEFSDDIVYSAQDFSGRIYLDNFRIVSIKTITVSDFSD